jgi:hypothetical protein
VRGVCEPSTLAASDAALGSPTTTCPPASDARGIEHPRDDNADFVLFGDDGRSVQVFFDVGSQVDQVRAVLAE